MALSVDSPQFRQALENQRQELREMIIDFDAEFADATFKKSCRCFVLYEDDRIVASGSFDYLLSRIKELTGLGRRGLKIEEVRA